MHKSDCKTKTSQVYLMMRENGGWNCITMIVIKEFSCASKTEARIEEDKIMREMKTSMNKNRAHTTPEEKNKQNKEYRENNKDKICEKVKEWCNANRDRINEKQKEYYQATKKLISKKDKELTSERQKGIIKQTEN